MWSWLRHMFTINQSVILTMPIVVLTVDLGDWQKCFHNNNTKFIFFNYGKLMEYRISIWEIPKILKQTLKALKILKKSMPLRINVLLNFRHYLLVIKKLFSSIFCWQSFVISIKGG